MVPPRTHVKCKNYSRKLPPRQWAARRFQPYSLLVIRLARVKDHIGILTTQSDNPPLFFRENIFHDVTGLEHGLSLPRRAGISRSPIMLPSGAHTCDAIDGHAVLVAFGQLLIGATTIKE